MNGSLNLWMSWWGSHLGICLRNSARSIFRRPHLLNKMHWNMGYAGGIFPWTMVELSSVSPDFSLWIGRFPGEFLHFSPRWCTVRCSDRGPRTRHVHLTWLHGGARLNGPSGNPWFAGKSSMDMFQKFLGDFPVTWKCHVWLAEGKPNYRLNWYEYDFKLKWNRSHWYIGKLEI